MCRSAASLRAQCASAVLALSYCAPASQMNSRSRRQSTNSTSTSAYADEQRRNELRAMMTKGKMIETPLYLHARAIGVHDCQIYGSIAAMEPLIDKIIAREAEIEVEKKEQEYISKLQALTVENIDLVIGQPRRAALARNEKLLMSSTCCACAVPMAACAVPMATCCVCWPTAFQVRLSPPPCLCPRSHAALRRCAPRRCCRSSIPMGTSYGTTTRASAGPKPSAYAAS